LTMPKYTVREENSKSKERPVKVWLEWPVKVWLESSGDEVKLKCLDEDGSSWSVLVLTADGRVRLLPFFGHSPFRTDDMGRIEVVE